jgi:hypothetical protein
MVLLMLSDWCLHQGASKKQAFAQALADLYVLAPHPHAFAHVHH